MPPKPRQIQIQQRGGLAAMQHLEARSDEELERETRHRAAAQAILGSRAADRYDAKATRAHFQKALAAARPQERMQLKRMADAALALAERRAGDLKESLEKLGQQPPSSRQLLALRFMGLVAPPASAGVLARARGILLALAIVVVLLAVGFGVVSAVALPFGGVGLGPAVFLGFVLIVAALGVLALLGRRRQSRARAAARAR